MTVNEFLADLETNQIYLLPIEGEIRWWKHDCSVLPQEYFTLMFKYMAEQKYPILEWLGRSMHFIAGGTACKNWQVHNFRITRQRVIQGQLTEWPGQEHPTSYRKS